MTAAENGSCEHCAPDLDGDRRRQSGATQRINLAERLAAGTLRVVNRDANAIPDRPGAVHVSQKPENRFVGSPAPISPRGRSRWISAGAT